MVKYTTKLTVREKYGFCKEGREKAYGFSRKRTRRGQGVRLKFVIHNS